MGERRGAYRVFVGKHEIKRPLRRLRSTWENNFQMYLQKVGWWTWTGLIWFRKGTGGEIL